MKIFSGGFDSNFSYILYDEKSKEAAILDISVDPTPILAYIKDKGLNLQFAVVMHSHFDHLVGYEFYQEHKIPLFGHESIKKEVDKKLKHEEEIKLGSSKLKVLHTPGHIYDSICIFVEGKLFTSDTLFIDSCGRCDFPGASIEDMYNSLYNVILKLPEDTIVYPGHDYGNKPFATLKEQKQTNVYLQAKTKNDFVLNRMKFYLS